MKFSDAEIEFIKRFADRIFDEHRKNGVFDAKKSRLHSSREINLNGIAAEFFVAKALNIYPNVQYHKDDGYDLVYGGLKIDVKNTTYENGKLFVRKPEADVYVLVVGEFPEFRIAGWIEKENLKTVEIKKRKYPGALQEDLKPLSQLKEEVQNGKSCSVCAV